MLVGHLENVLFFSEALYDVDSESYKPVFTQDVGKHLGLAIASVENEIREYNKNPRISKFSGYRLQSTYVPMLEMLRAFYRIFDTDYTRTPNYAKRILSAVELFQETIGTECQAEHQQAKIRISKILHTLEERAKARWI